MTDPSGLLPPEMPRHDRFADPLDPALRLLFEDPSAGRLVADQNGRVLRASVRLCHMVGPALDLSPGTPLRLLFAEADREAVWARVAALLEGLAGAAEAEPLTVQLGGGADPPLAVRVICMPLAGPEGSVAGVLLSAQDVSVPSRLQAQLAQSQRLQMAGQLAAGVGHDVNNLLTAILGGADAIAARAGSDAATAEDVAAIRAGAVRAAALVQHLLAVGRQQTSAPRVLALNTVIEDLAAVLRRLLGNRVRLELALQQPSPQVVVDPVALDRVLVNLAVNARDAMPAGGTLTLHTGVLALHRPLPQGAETIPPGRYAMIEVQDTGAGIPAEVLPHIFEPFFTTRRDAGGTGLGLSTVLAIARQCGGFLTVESTPGQGTRMRLGLPALEEAAAVPVGPFVATGAVQPPLPFLDPPGPSHGLVLLVEDEDVVRRVAERALIRHGWRVLAAPTAEAALGLLASDPPPLLAAVVSDLVLPGMGGADLLQAVRARLGAPLVPGVLVSGYTAEDVGDTIAAVPGSGRTRFLAKPYDITQLAAMLAEVVG